MRAWLLVVAAGCGAGTGFPVVARGPIAAPRRLMKLATVIVGTDTERFGRVGANPERFALANQIARFVENEGAALCVMPAGYLTATSGRPTAIRSSAAQLASVFAVDLVAGIDAAHTTIGAKLRGAAEVYPGRRRTTWRPGSWTWPADGLGC